MLEAIGFDVMSYASLQHKAPAAFAQSAHESRSDRYGFVPTSEVIAGLQKAGFHPTHAIQAKSRDESRQHYTKHMLRFRRQGEAIAGMVPEVVMLNSHDGTSSYQLIGGLFRFVCFNGLMVGDMYSQIRVMHQKDQVRDVIEGSYTVIDESKKALSRALEMGRVMLSTDERRLLATTAHAERFGASEIAGCVTVEHLLKPRREADTNNDLFSVMNRIQENVIRGGVKAWGRNQQNRMRQVTTREVKGIDQTVSLNRALWNAAETLMQLKTGY